MSKEFDAFVLRTLPICAGIALIAYFFQDASSPPVPRELVNGVYQNVCCGSLTIKDGALLVGEDRTRFSLARDNISPFLLPGEAVSVVDGKLLTIGGRLPYKLRLKGGSRLDAIEIASAEGDASYTFIRR